MHPRIFAAREQKAREKLVSASKSLAEGLGMTDLADAIANAHHKDAKIAGLYRSEAVAEFVDALAQSFRVVGPALTEEAVVERLESIDLSKTSMEKIRKEFDVEPEQDPEPEGDQEPEPEGEQV